MKLEVPGAVLNVELRGPSSGTPVVFLHGFPLSHAMWNPQLDAFGDRYRLVAPDIRGHGASTAGDGQYTMELLADDLLALLDALGEEPVVACGLSMGGYIVLRALERAPERFRAVVLADTRSQADGDDARLARARAIAALKQDGVAAFAEDFVDKLLGPSTLERRPAVRAAVLAMIAPNGVLGLAGALLAIATRTDTGGALRALEVPALVVVGEDDAITPPDASREMEELAPGSTLEVIPGAGHLSNLENPEAFNRVLGAFLEGVLER